MNCTTCKAPIAPEEAREHQGKTLCEDCYIDALSPAKFCDPWADYAAKSAIKHNQTTDLSPNQTTILSMIKDCGEVSRADLTEKLKDRIPAGDVERECAALKRMGKIAIQRKNQQPYISLQS